MEEAVSVILREIRSLLKELSRQSTTNTGDNAYLITALSGGAIVTHNDKAAKAPSVADAPIVEALTLKAFPNPSTNYFTLKLQAGLMKKSIESRGFVGKTGVLNQRLL